MQESAVQANKCAKNAMRNKDTGRGSEKRCQVKEDVHVPAGQNKSNTRTQTTRQGRDRRACELQRAVQCT